jgi:hypothetical protein
VMTSRRLMSDMGLLSRFVPIPPFMALAAASGLNANRSQREARTAFFAMAAGLVSSRPLLMSNCAPDRLRRLSVDADKCPSHVFRVTEPDRLRDAFDRFDSRLYPASG